MVQTFIESVEITDWIFPCNPKDYDIDRAYRDLDYVEWGCHNLKLDVGDYVYIYVTRPVAAIRYKCIVTHSYRGYTTIDDSEYGGNPAGVKENVVELKFLVEYLGVGITLDTIREHGVNKHFSIQSPFRMPEDLKQYIDVLEAESFSDDEDSDFSTEETAFKNLKGFEREAVVKARVNQSAFRTALLNKYGKCVLCSINKQQFLIASHIKPWVVSDEDEKTNTENGLLLCPNHDKLFDTGFISFSNTGKILISKELDEETLLSMNIHPSMSIDMSEKQKAFMEYHRKHIFVDS
ncbi:MAG: HNH endonuclease [Solobacterium sp.]|nr:HNH endonuclease [Solobacterium sp.]